MYHTNRVAIVSTDDAARVYLTGTDKDIPIIEFGDHEASTEITLNSKLLPPTAQAAWLRGLAKQLLNLANEIDATDRQARAVAALRDKLTGTGVA